MDELRFQSLLDLLYDASVDSSGQVSLASQLAELVGVGSCALVTLDRAADVGKLVSVTANIASHADAYNSHFYRQSLLVREFAPIAPSAVRVGQEIIADDEFERSEFYNEFVKRTGVFNVVGGSVPLGDKMIGIIGFHRPKHMGQFTSEGKGILEGLLPHLQRAMQIRRRIGDLELVNSAAMEGLDRLRTAVIITDEEARVRFANQKALMLFEGGDGIACGRGRLIANSHPETDELHRLIRQVAATSRSHGTHPGGGMALSRKERRPLGALICPLGGAAADAGFHRGACALIFVRDTEERPRVSPVLLHATFGFTAAEARLVAALMDGKTLEQISQERGTSLNTLRTHLKSVMAKTETHRMTELSSLLCRSIATVGWHEESMR